MVADSPRRRRMGRIFGNDDRTVIVALDGAPVTGPVSGMLNCEPVFRAVADGGADAVLVTYGLAQRYGHLVGDLGMLLRCDGGVSHVRDTVSWRLLYGAADALRLGADGVACNVFPQSQREELTQSHLAQLVVDCAPWNLPVMAEALPGGFMAGQEQRTAEAVSFASRAAAELGADFIKTAYTGSRASFAEVVESSYLPVVVLGGAAGEPANVFRTVHDAISAGAAGVAIGRNIWQHPDPQAMTRAIVALVHENASIEDALAMVGGRELAPIS